MSSRPLDSEDVRRHHPSLSHLRFGRLEASDTGGDVECFIQTSDERGICVRKLDGSVRERLTPQLANFQIKALLRQTEVAQHFNERDWLEFIENFFVEIQYAVLDRSVEVE